MKIKTTELEGLALDWAVASCEGLLAFGCSKTASGLLRITLSTGEHEVFNPSGSREQGGAIIERERLLTEPEIGKEGTGNAWSAVTMGGAVGFGPTLLVAAMRCFVRSRMGEWVEVPSGLVCADRQRADAPSLRQPVAALTGLELDRAVAAGVLMPEPSPPQGGAGAVINEAQRLLLRHYEGGEFAHLIEELEAIDHGDPERVLSMASGRVDECGDGLLRFLFVELSDNEDCDSLEEAVSRIDTALRQLAEVSARIEADRVDRVLGLRQQ